MLFSDCQRIETYIIISPDIMFLQSVKPQKSNRLWLLFSLILILVIQFHFLNELPVVLSDAGKVRAAGGAGHGVVPEPGFARGALILVIGHIVRMMNPDRVMLLRPCVLILSLSADQHGKQNNAGDKP